MSTKQLYEKTSEGMKEVNPLIALEDIYSRMSDTPLGVLVTLYNHVKCEWKGNVAETRKTVPMFLRKSGLFITYNNGTKYITEFFSAGTDQINTENWIKDTNWALVPDEDYISAGVKPGVGSIGYEQLNNNLKQLFREKVNVTNFPDDEDITSVDNMLKLKDREVDAANFQSKGYVILRKNLRLINGVVKNILTQNMINKPNTIYEIRYDFDLNSETINIPDNCTLKFEGGRLNNGIINGNNTGLVGRTFNLSNVLNNTFFFINHPDEYFASDFITNNIDDSFQKLIDLAKYNNKTVIIDLSLKISKLIKIPTQFKIKGSNRRIASIKLLTELSGFILGSSDDSEKVYEVDFSDISINGTDIANYGIQCYRISQCRFTNIYIGNCKITNLLLHESSINWFTKCYFYNSCTSIVLYNSSYNVFSGANFWENKIIFSINNNIDQLIITDSWIERFEKLFIGTNISMKMFISTTSFLKSSNGECSLCDLSSEQEKSSVVININQCRFFFINSISTNLVKVSNRNSYFYLDVRQSYLYAPKLKYIIDNTTDNNRESIVLCWNGNNGFKLSEDNMFSNPSNASFRGIYVSTTGEQLLYNTLVLPSKFILPIDRCSPGTINYNKTNETIQVIVDNHNQKTLMYKFSNFNNDSKPNTGEFCEIFINNTKRRLELWNGLKFTNLDGTNINDFDIEGPSSKRPIFKTGTNYWYKFYDTTLQQYIVWNGTRWITSDGNPADAKKQGTTEERPTSINIGFIYKDTTLNKLIIWDGTSWVNMDGTTLI